MMRFVVTDRSRRIRCAAGSAALFIAPFFAPTTATAQVIAVRTLPIADADQFSFFPSLTGGMGGVRIAIADSVHDPFINPATGARLQRPLFFSAPTFFSVSRRTGSGTTIPFGAITRVGSSFGGVVAAIQSINDAQPFASAFFDAGSNAGEGSHSNRYGLLMLGHSFTAAKLSVGASALWSDLASIDGTALLYADSRDVSQAGSATDVRLGVLKEWNRGHSLEALLFNRRVGMTHDITYSDLFWDPIGRRTITHDRVEHERDRANTWGMHVEYAQPIGDSGWRGGAIFTANRIDNPNRPAYEIETVPGVHSRSSAFNLGVGFARSLGATTVAVDAIYEPIWSRIWGDTGSASTNQTARPGNELETRLRFSNAIVRTGLSYDHALPDEEWKFQLQLGLAARSISYTASTREGDKSWMEWTRTLGATFRYGSIEFQYRGGMTTGAGRPGVSPNIAVPPQPGPGISSFAPPPQVPATSLHNVRVMTHQLSFSMRIR